MASILSVSRDLLRKQTGNAMLKIQEQGTPFVFEFNPDEFHVSAHGEFSSKERPGKDAPLTQFAGGGQRTLELKLFFDTSESYEIKTGLSFLKPQKNEKTDVSAYTNKLEELVKVKGKLHHPPLVTFQWSSTEFTGVVTGVRTHYIMFDQSGMPVRAEVELTLLETKLEELERNEPLQSPGQTKSVVATSDSSLWNIAEREYGDCGYWREIARANDIMNPLDIPPGTYLKVPALYL